MIPIKVMVGKWAEQILARPSLELAKECEVVGIVDRHLGPRWEFAKIEMFVQPAQELSIQLSLEGSEATLTHEKQQYLEAAISGLLDVLLVSGAFPLRHVQIQIKALEVHAIDSSPLAFLLAGRDAGKKIMSLNK